MLMEIFSFLTFGEIVLKIRLLSKSVSRKLVQSPGVLNQPKSIRIGLRNMPNEKMRQVYESGLDKRFFGLWLYLARFSNLISVTFQANFNG